MIRKMFELLDRQRLLRPSKTLVSCFCTGTFAENPLIGAAMLIGLPNRLAKMEALQLLPSRSSKIPHDSRSRWIPDHPLGLSGETQGRTYRVEA
jgi:hypothetical protein